MWDHDSWHILNVCGGRGATWDLAMDVAYSNTRNLAMLGPRTATRARSPGPRAAGGREAIRCKISPGPRAHPEPKPYLLGVSLLANGRTRILPRGLPACLWPWQLASSGQYICACAKKKLSTNKIMLCATCSTPLPLPSWGWGRQLIENQFTRGPHF